MKRIYITPEVFAVELGFRQNVMLSASDGEGNLISDGGDGDGSDIGAKTYSGKSLWDEEW